MIFTEDILDREGIAQHHNSGPTVHAKVTYGPTIVQMLAPKPAKTFQDYPDNILTRYILRDFGVYMKRIDTVRDVYFPGSLRDTPEKWGFCLRRS